MTADEVVQFVEARHGIRVVVEGRCPGGEVGAYFGRLPDGEAIVFKWSENADREPQIAAMVEAVNGLRDVGYPAPRYGPVLAFDGGVFTAQRRAAGSWSDVVSDRLGAQLLAARRIAVGRGVLVDDESWGEFVRRTLCVGADGFALHETLRTHSKATREMLAWIESVGSQTTAAAFHERDLVHLDFHHRNALQTRDGELDVIVDAEGMRQGDAAFDLVTLYFGLSTAACSEDLKERVWLEAVEVTTTDVLRAYVAHMSLRLVDWMIRFHPEQIDFWLQVSQRAARRVG